MQNKRCTIKDVAREAEVSTGTISRYLNNKGYVSKEARESIKKAIESLQYIPNAEARNLVRQTNNLVGVISAEINNPFLGELMARVETGLARKGYSVMLCNAGFKSEKIELFVNDLLMRNGAGLIIIASDIEQENKALMQKVNRFMAGVSVGQQIKGFDCLNFADFDLTAALTEHLIEMGHKEIACIAFNRAGTQTLERKRGVIETLQKHNLPVRNQFFVGFEDDTQYEVGENAGYICAKKLFALKELPTAIVSINDNYAIGAYKAATEAGLVVGDDISIVGFDNIDISSFMQPALTTVDCNTAEMAEIATNLLHSRINGENGGESRCIMLPAQIIYRNSVKNINPK